MMEFDHEPIPGLPGELPEGERILWQGKPEAALLARNVFKTRWVMGYFAVLMLVALAAGSIGGAVATFIVGLVAIGILKLMARAVAKATIYTLTNRRVVLRIGVAIEKCINLPLTMVGAADLEDRGLGHGDIVLTLMGEKRLSWFLLWPHVSGSKNGNPRQALRAVPEVEKVARLLADASAQLVPIERGAVETAPVSGPLKEAHA